MWVDPRIDFESGELMSSLSPIAPACRRLPAEPIVIGCRVAELQGQSAGLLVALDVSSSCLSSLALRRIHRQ
jgi:hypothetical protein